ncbi:hypothetical protein NF680_14915 [Pseudomonas siliginis]|nr:hypothetical protein [Pseudomonas siliginis]UST98490.1 hypothetical protein NF680_14915 [Pseudomonas siliginis]
MLAADQTMHRAEIDRLHEVLAFLRTVQHLSAFRRAQLHVGEGQVQGAFAREDQCRTFFDGAALILADAFAAMQQCADDTFQHAVFVELAAETVDDVQPTVAQAADAHGARGQGVRQREFAAGVEGFFHQAVREGQQLHVGVAQGAGGGADDRGFGRCGCREVGGVHH